MNAQPQRTLLSRLRLARAMLWLLGTALAGIVTAQDAAGPQLRDISYSALPGDRVQVRLQLSAPVASDPLSFTIDNPARIAIDFPGVGLGLGERSRTIGVGAAQSVSAVEAEGRTRVVLNLARMVPYNLAVDGNDLLITLEAGAEAPSALEVASGDERDLKQEAAALESIDFRRGERGEGRVVVVLGDPAMPVNVTEQGGQIIVDFPLANLPERLNRKLDVIDFATPVKLVDTFSRGRGARMVITPTGDYDHLAYQSDETFTVEVKPLTKAEVEEAKKAKLGYTGERLSLNFQDIEVRAVLQLIADFTGFNMVASDSVGGNVTLRLKNVPWDQALDIILKSKGLGMRQAGNVIMVAPQDEIAAREKLELEAQQALIELAPLKTEFMQVNYAKAADIAKLLKAQENRLLSERGNVTLDERTNTLLVQDTGDKLAEIRGVVQTLDIPVRQVLIESRIVVANENFAKELGVQFGYAKNFRPNDTIGSEPELDLARIGGRRGGNYDIPTAPGFANEDDQPQYIVDLPASQVAGTAAIGLAIGRIGTYLLELELSAAQAEGRSEVISAPRVITANQKEALIETGEEIPYQEAASSGATTVAFKKAVLSLRVTPRITPDERVIMDLQVTQDRADFSRQVAGVPPILTNEVQTQVLVDNGETVVLGGVFRTNTEKNVNRVPFFSDLPYFGRLFRRDLNRDTKDELLIFVTPKIVKDTLAVQ